MCCFHDGTLFYEVISCFFHVATWCDMRLLSMPLGGLQLENPQCVAGTCWILQNEVLPLMQKLMPLHTVLSAFIEIETCPFHIPCINRCRWICLRQGSAWHSKSMSQRGTNQHQRVETEAQTSKRPMIVTCREICAVDGSQLFSNGAFEVLSSVQLYLT